jgi:hypothetical protein
MKKLSFTLLFLIVSVLTHAQTIIYEVLAANENSVMQAMSGHKFSFLYSGTSDYNMKFDTYSVTDKTYFTCYFNSEGKCCQCLIVTPTSTLLENLEFLNKNFVTVDNTHWTDEKGTMNIHLYTDDPDRNVYCISYIVTSLYTQ